MCSTMLSIAYFPHNHTNSDKCNMQRVWRPLWQKRRRHMTLNCYPPCSKCHQKDLSLRVLSWASGLSQLVVCVLHPFPAQHKKQKQRDSLVFASWQMQSPKHLVHPIPLSSNTADSSLFPVIKKTRQDFQHTSAALLDSRRMCSFCSAHN